MTRRTRTQTQAAVQGIEMVQLMVLLRVVRHRSIEDIIRLLSCRLIGRHAKGGFQFVCRFTQKLIAALPYCYLEPSNNMKNNMKFMKKTGEILVDIENLFPKA